jgi:hypothetical protein
MATAQPKQSSIKDLFARAADVPGLHESGRLRPVLAFGAKRPMAPLSTAGEPSPKKRAILSVEKHGPVLAAFVRPKKVDAADAGRSEADVQSLLAWCVLEFVAVQNVVTVAYERAACSRHA